MHLLFFRDRDTFSKTISKTTNSYGRYTYAPNMCRSHNVQSVRVLVFIRHFGLIKILDCCFALHSVQGGSSLTSVALHVR